MTCHRAARFLRHIAVAHAAALLLAVAVFGTAHARAQATAPSAAPLAPSSPAVTPTSPAVTPIPPAPGPVSPNTTHEPTSAGTSNRAIQQQIRALAPLPNVSLNVAARSREILAHLGAVLRFYRESLTPVQKIGEPSDVLSQEQTATEATQIAQLAFHSAQNEAALFTRVKDTSGSTPSGPEENAAPEQTEAQRSLALRDRVNAQLAALETQDLALEKQEATARGPALVLLQQRHQQIEGEIQLQKAMSSALEKLTASADSRPGKGLQGDIARLLASSPELGTDKPRPIAPLVLANLSATREAGVSTQASAIFQLLSALHTIDQRIAETNLLRQQAIDLRTPITKILRGVVQDGQTLQQTTPAPSTPNPATGDAATLQATRDRYDELTRTFNVLATAALPLSQEIVLLEQHRASLISWRSAIDAEYDLVLQSLLWRVLGIAIAMGVLLLVGELWRRATTRYVGDLRRRRQLLLIRRVVIGFLGGCVVIFGFVTQFNSLATFAGFITAGIAVGLQTILLSVAAYFFIIGRYGIRVGDRVTVAGVTGDVIEVGLVRFYLVELTGTGTELHSTGRVAVFANSVLFQAGTPLYKQMPGTEYAWHELTVKLNSGADFQHAADSVLHAVSEIYNTYKAHIDQQHQRVEAWIDAGIQAPAIQSRLQLAEGGLQFAVLFPVEIQSAAETDGKITRLLVNIMNTDEDLRKAINEAPVIKAAIKG